VKKIGAADVVKLFKQGVPEPSILEVIQGNQIDFNPSDIDTVVLVNEAKLPVSIQNAMRAKVGAPLLTAPAAAKPKPPAAATKPPAAAPKPPVAAPTKPAAAPAPAK
jgi:hypothetical protein